MSVAKCAEYLDIFTHKTIVTSILIASVMLMIFVVDLQFTTELYIGVLYIIVVMLSLWLPNINYTFAFAFVSTLLTSFGYFYSIYNISPSAYFHVANFINLILTLSAIWITTLISTYIKSISIALKKRETIDRAILNTSIDPIIIIDRKGMIESASKTIEKSFGWGAKEIQGKSFSALLSNKFKEPYLNLIRDYPNVPNLDIVGKTQEAIAIHRLQREIPCEISINYIEIPEIKESFFTAVLRDISSRKAYEEKLSWISTHDELTNIYNRRFFNQQIEIEWRRLLRSHENLALIMLDVDFFKNYNDSLGHQSGDNCLRMIAECLTKCCRRAGEIVARYGGEEFVVLLPNTDIDGALLVAEHAAREISNLNIPHPASPVCKKISVSMGVASMIPLMGCSYERLIHFTDQALYQAKQTGRNKHCIYQD